jgi:predicted lipid-binding transport protein (Tim44 family)
MTRTGRRRRARPLAVLRPRARTVAAAIAAAGAVVALWLSTGPSALDARVGGGGSFGRSSSFGRSYSSGGGYSRSTSSSYGSSSSRSTSSSYGSSSSRSYGGSSYGYGSSSGSRSYSSSYGGSSSRGHGSSSYGGSYGSGSSSGGGSTGTSPGEPPSNLEPAVEAVGRFTDRALHVVAILMPFLAFLLALWIAYALAQAGRGGAGADEHSLEELTAVRIARERQAEQAAIAAQIRRLREMDPNFSRPVFLDFVQLLYARAVPARATGEVGPVAPYVDPDLARTWQHTARRRVPPVDRVDGIVIGGVRIVDVQWGHQVRVVVELEACMVESGPGGVPGRPVFRHERWTLVRDPSVLSRKPEEVRALSCPSCGAPCEVKPDGSCAFCGLVASGGRFHWTLADVRIMLEGPPPSAEQLAGGGEEFGTNLPTLMQTNFQDHKRAFLGRHPDFDWGTFQCRVRETFLALQKAWTDGDWDRARAFETDNLYSSHRYWIEAYRAAGLRNVLDQIAIEQLVPVKYEQDAFYESITVRIFAHMLDYTVDSPGRVVAGSRTDARRFSEYWTFIAATGSDLNRPLAAARCPSCSAEMKLSETGVCAHCSATITSGRFGWVLSLIEQDEAYGG